MSTQEFNTAAPFGSISIFHVVAAFERAVDAVVAWRDARATRSMLSRLSNDQLEDVGLERAQIPDLVSEIKHR